MTDTREPGSEFFAVHTTSSVVISFADGLSSLELVNEVGEYVFFIIGRAIGAAWLALK